MDNFTILEKKFIKILTKYINEVCPQKRASKYSIFYYVSHIFYVLKTGIQWSFLNCASHFSSVYKKFIKWSNLNIFNDFYKKKLDSYILQENIKHNYFCDMFVDSSHTKNINGVDCIGRNHYDRFRNSTKCHVIIDHNKIPLSYTFTPGNISDSTQTEILVNKLPKLTYDNRKHYCLVGDKGYINRETFKNLKQKKTTLIVPRRKNTKNHPKYSYYKKIKLNKRISVEHFFNIIDKYKRIILRFEKKIKYFESFNLIVFGYLICKFTS